MCPESKQQKHEYLCRDGDIQSFPASSLTWSVGAQREQNMKKRQMTCQELEPQELLSADVAQLPQASIRLQRLSNIHRGHVIVWAFCMGEVCCWFHLGLRAFIVAGSGLGCRVTLASFAVQGLGVSTLGSSVASTYCGVQHECRVCSTKLSI